LRAVSMRTGVDYTRVCYYDFDYVYDVLRNLDYNYEYTLGKNVL